MPIVQFYLVDGQHSDESIGALLVDATYFYVDTLYPDLDPKPIERVRAFVSPVPPQQWATAGQLASDGGALAPYFTCLALAGRPVEQLQDLLAGFTDLVERHLACDRKAIRGQIISIDPAHWSIGGRPASDLRQNEVGLRAGK
jgi:phenylpyruvate tautomerase PptA (4-oxalocrotonate tautomerase family)